jgi:hypothetical protein
MALSRSKCVFARFPIGGGGGREKKETKRTGKKDENENNLHAINGALFSVKYSLRYFTGSVIEL